MKTAYLDCFSGISGDMTIAAFLDAGLPLKLLKDALAGLDLKGYSIGSVRVRRGAISGTQFRCVAGRHRGHGHRSLREIRSLIGRSALSRRAKSLSREIFDNIASAEAKVHGVKARESVFFHELGDIDSIVDIVGTAIAVEAMDIGEVLSSPVTMGRTLVRTGHGVIPIPGPAAVELLRGAPVEISAAPAELVTPTGAGILKTLAVRFGPMPHMEIESIGYGAGSLDLKDAPNMLRLFIGRRTAGLCDGNVKVVEANIDDMNPQYFEHVQERLLRAGALDAYVTPIQMKKSRPAFKLSAICESRDLRKVAGIMLAETTTIGVRFYDAGRITLERTVKEARTRYGTIRVKVSGDKAGERTISPEYDDCKKAAVRSGVPLKSVFDAARAIIK